VSRRRVTVVVVRTGEVDRAAEALRAAVGLGLRGARVEVFAGAWAAHDDPRVRRALATLAELAQPLRGDDQLAAALAGADAVEVWS